MKLLIILISVLTVFSFTSMFYFNSVDAQYLGPTVEEMTEEEREQYYEYQKLRLYTFKFQNGDELSPLKQSKIGVSPDNIVCFKHDYQLILKTTNNSPACVKPESLPKLVERGWTKSEADISDEHIIKYSPVLFKGSGVDLKDAELISLLKEKQKQFDPAFDEFGVEGLYPIVGESFSIGHNAYSLDEEYVGNPTALDIHILKEEFTKTNLEKVDQMVRKYVGYEIDIVYSKGGYVVTSDPFGYPDFTDSAIIKGEDSISIPLSHTQNKQTQIQFWYIDDVTLDCNTLEMKRGEMLTAKIRDVKNNTVRSLDRGSFHMGCPDYPQMNTLEKRVKFSYSATMVNDKNGTYYLIIKNPQDKEIEVSFVMWVNLLFDPPPKK